MPISKPSTLPRWSDVSGTKTAPSSGRQDTGFDANDVPTSGLFNWLFNLYYQWAQWLDDLVNQALTWTAAHIWTLNSGTDAIHATQDGSASALVGVATNAAVRDAAGVWGASTGGAHGVKAKNLSGLANALDVEGPSLLTGTLQVSDDTVLSGDLGVNGASTFNGGGIIPNTSQLDVQGNATVKLASNPAAGDATAGIFTNRLHAANLVKAWGYILVDHTLGASYSDGFNLDTVIGALIEGDNKTIKVTFKQAMANTNYAVVFGGHVGAVNEVLVPHVVEQATTYFRFQTMGITTAPAAAYANWSARDGLIPFAVLGRM